LRRQRIATGTRSERALAVTAGRFVQRSELAVRAGVGKTGKPKS